MGRIKGKRLDIDAIISSYQIGGGNAVRVAKEFGCSHSYVLKLLKDRNIPVIPQTIVQRKRNVNESAKEIYADYSDKITYQSFQALLWGRHYNHLPIYKKKEKRWINI